MTQLRRQMERKVDAPLHWRENVAAGGPTLSGYEESERMLASVKLLSQNWHSVDSSPGCDGTICRTADGGIEIAQNGCPPHLELNFELTFGTSQSELHGRASGRAFYWMRDNEPLVSYGNVLVDLATLTGRVKVSWPTATGERSGRLLIGFEFLADDTIGALSTTPSVLCHPISSSRPIRLAGPSSRR